MHSITKWCNIHFHYIKLHSTVQSQNINLPLSRAAELVSFLYLALGRHPVCPPPLGDDHHCAHWWPAGRLPAQQEHPVNYHSQENHELRRWEVWTEDEIKNFHTSLCTATGCYFDGVRSIVLFSKCSQLPAGLQRWFCLYFCKNLSVQYFSTRDESLIVTVHWLHICHLRNWVQTMYHA